MISLIGNFSLGAALLVALTGALIAIAAGATKSDLFARLSRWAVGIIALLFTLASAALLTAFINNDFQFEYVAGYSEKALPIGYKIAAFWAGQEGSLLLWGWMLAVLCWIAVINFRKWNGLDSAITNAVMALACGFFAALILFAANPFVMLENVTPHDGRGLNPMLQDPGMILHPPLLFMGYAGFTIPFAVMCGVLVAGRRDNHWLSLIRRWLLVSWVFLTAGIVLGAWWAYVELGWGGYWAWDPVENASLLPWLTATALLHSIMVQQHRGMFKKWNVSLIAATFILCIFGTYITRSGIIDSVHSFGESPIGTFFLTFMMIGIFGSLFMIVWRRKQLAPEHEIESLISREGAFLLGNVLLVIMTATILIGTIFPLISELFANKTITVKPEFYNTVVAPMGILLAGIMALGPVLAFGKAAAVKILKSLTYPAIAATVVTLGFGIGGVRNPWALLCVVIATLGTFAVIIGFITSVSARHKSTGENWITASIRLVDKNHRRYGGQLAHLGVMMVVVGIAGSSIYEHIEDYKLSVGQTVELKNKSLTLLKVEQIDGPNYQAVQAVLLLTDASGKKTYLTPQKRYYDKWRDEANTEIALSSGFIEDIYIILGGWTSGGQVVQIRAMANPLIMWIWIGGIIMSLGCFFCILPRILPLAKRVEETAPSKSNNKGKLSLINPAMQKDTLGAKA